MNSIIFVVLMIIASAITAVGYFLVTKFLGIEAVKKPETDIFKKRGKVTPLERVTPGMHFFRGAVVLSELDTKNKSITLDLFSFPDDFSEIKTDQKNSGKGIVFYSDIRDALNGRHGPHQERGCIIMAETEGEREINNIQLTAKSWKLKGFSFPQCEYSGCEKTPKYITSQGALCTPHMTKSNPEKKIFIHGINNDTDRMKWKINGSPKIGFHILDFHQLRNGQL